MSGNIVNRPRPGKYIDIILDEVYNKSVPKPINLRPGYDIEYIRNRYGFLYPGQFKKMVEVESRAPNESSKPGSSHGSSRVESGRVSIFLTRI